MPTNAMTALTKSLGFGGVSAELKTLSTKATAKSAISESKHSLRRSQTFQSLRGCITFLVRRTFQDRRRVCKRFVKTARLRSVRERETIVRNA